MIRAIHYTNPDAFRAARHPGATHFDLTKGGPDEAILWFFCPCGCGGPVRLKLGIGVKPADSPSWNWNGSITEPTLTPSVNRLDCGWHGWLRDGYWEEA